mmetsp:Transcript_13095/g.35053  ORF Transcript_13095/g.35053 Transcript_13095/m.35053 type:complete len:226 (-) Transcript_13095:332-1009(-)
MADRVSVALRTLSSVLDCCLSSSLLAKYIIKGFTTITTTIQMRPMKTDTPTKRYSENSEITTLSGDAIRICMYLTTRLDLSMSVVIKLFNLPVENFRKTSWRSVSTLWKIVVVMDDWIRSPRLCRPMDTLLSMTTESNCTRKNRAARVKPFQAGLFSSSTKFVIKLRKRGKEKSKHACTMRPTQSNHILGQCIANKTRKSVQPRPRRRPGLSAAARFLQWKTNAS